MLPNINDANCNVEPSFSFLAFSAVFSYFDSIEGLMSLFPYSNALPLNSRSFSFPFSGWLRCHLPMHNLTVCHSNLNISSWYLLNENILKVMIVQVSNPLALPYSPSIYLPHLLIWFCHPAFLLLDRIRCARPQPPNPLVAGWAVIGFLCSTREREAGRREWISVLLRLPRQSGEACTYDVCTPWGGS